MVNTPGEDSTYAERLKWAMDQRNMTTPLLAKALDVSPNAVKKVLVGGSNAMSAPNNARAAALLKVSSDWLATGIGRAERSVMSATELDGLEGMLVALFRQLSPEHRDDLLTRANNLANVGNKTPNAGDPFAGKRPPGENTRSKQKPMLIKELSRADDMLIEWLPAKKSIDKDEGGKS